MLAPVYKLVIKKIMATFSVVHAFLTFFTNIGGLVLGLLKNEKLIFLYKKFVPMKSSTL